MGMKNVSKLVLQWCAIRTITTRMSLRSLLPLLGALMCTAPVGVAKEGWEQMKAGMNPVDTTSALGAPLFKNRGRGFELWIYDSGAEVVCFRGLVVAWTTPGRIGGEEGRQLDLRPLLKVLPTPPPLSAAMPETDADLQLNSVRTMRLPRL